MGIKHIVYFRHMYYMYELTFVECETKTSRPLKLEGILKKRFIGNACISTREQTCVIV